MIWCPIPHSHSISLVFVYPAPTNCFKQLLHLLYTGRFKLLLFWVQSHWHFAVSKQSFDKTPNHFPLNFLTMLTMYESSRVCSFKCDCCWAWGCALAESTCEAGIWERNTCCEQEWERILIPLVIPIHSFNFVSLFLFIICWWYWD